MLKDHLAKCQAQPTFSENESYATDYVQRQLGDFHQIDFYQVVPMFRENVGVAEDDCDEEDEEMYELEEDYAL